MLGLLMAGLLGFGGSGLTSLVEFSGFGRRHNGVVLATYWWFARTLFIPWEFVDQRWRYPRYGRRHKELLVRGLAAQCSAIVTVHISSSY
jgi:hypothetical protein